LRKTPTSPSRVIWQRGTEGLFVAQAIDRCFFKECIWLLPQAKRPKGYIEPAVYQHIHEVSDVALVGKNQFEDGGSLIDMIDVDGLDVAACLSGKAGDLCDNAGMIGHGNTYFHQTRGIRDPAGRDGCPKLRGIRKQTGEFARIARCKL
jgi:hypothetical protein